jgi:uncharacterized membrane protein YkoI
MQSLRLTLLFLFIVVAPASHAIVFNPGSLLIAHVLLVAAAATSEDDAAKSVRAQTGGRVLSVESANKGGSTIYLVKVLLPSGTVRVVEVTGK